MDQEVADADACMLSIPCVCIYQVAATFWLKWRHGHHPESVTSVQIRLRQSMRVYLKNNPARFHSDPIWTDGALGFSEEVAPTRRRRRSTSI